MDNGIKIYTVNFIVNSKELDNVFFLSQTYALKLKSHGHNKYYKFLCM